MLSNHAFLIVISVAHAMLRCSGRFPRKDFLCPLPLPARFIVRAFSIQVPCPRVYRKSLKSLLMDQSYLRGMQ